MNILKAHKNINLDRKFPRNLLTTPLMYNSKSISFPSGIKVGHLRKINIKQMDAQVRTSSKILYLSNISLVYMSK